MKDVIMINREYYDDVYKMPDNIMAQLRQRLSFDQYYKSSINWHLLSGCILREQRHCIGSVLEIGVGFGLTLRRFPRTTFLCGTDISGNAVSLLYRMLGVREGRRVLFCINDSNGGIPFNSKFDVIICSHVLEHVPDDAVVLQECKRLLASNGVLLLNVPINERTPDSRHLRHYDEHTIGNKLRKARFKVLRQVEADRWGAFFANWPDQNNPTRKIIRAVLAVLPHPMVEVAGNILLRHLPCQQLALLAGHD